MYSIIKSYSIPLSEHNANIGKLKRFLPWTLKNIPVLSQKFTGKPQFIIQREKSFISLIREDHQNRLKELSETPEPSLGRQLTISEWKSIVHPGAEDVYKLPVTMHDVFFQNGVTVKTGNPYRNNSWEEFYLALSCRARGIVEAKSPIGFSFRMDDPYGVKEPGRMFYKHLQGVDLINAMKSESKDTINWAVWEVGKFFSRLVKARLHLADPHRLGNFFLEQTPSTKVFRFLDLERMRYTKHLNRVMAREMVEAFIKEAMQIGFLNEEKLGEFKIVCGCF
jgi:hypothetical protein